MSTNQPAIWDHDRNCAMAACLAGGDRWSIERLAAFFDVSVTTARVMVDRGNAIKGARLTASSRERIGKREEARS
jgi:hypothetical protein